MEKKTIIHECVLLFLEEHLSQLVKLKVASRAKYKQYEEAMMNYLAAEGCEDEERSELYNRELQMRYLEVFNKLFHAIDANPALLEDNLVKEFLHLMERLEKVDRAHIDLPKDEDIRYADMFKYDDDTFDLEEVILCLSPGTPMEKEDKMEDMSPEELLSLLEHRFYHCVPEWIDDLTCWDLKLLRNLVHAKNGRCPINNTPQMLLVEHLRMLDRSLGDEEVSAEYILYPDIRDALSPYLEDAVKRKEESPEGYLEQLFMGVMNMVGVIDEALAMKTMKQLLQQANNGLTDKDVDYFFAHSMLVRYYRGSYVCSPGGLLWSHLSQEWCEDVRNGLKTWIPTDLGEVMAHGEYPYLVPYRKEEQTLWNLLREQNSPEDASYMLTMLYTHLQDSEYTVQQMLEDFGEYYQFTGINEVRRVMPVLLAFANGIPKLFLKGHSSEEIARCEKPLSSHKVGRNDPCPCGSGKKYKHCCGK